MIKGRKYIMKKDLCVNPCKSSLLGVYKVSNLSRRKSWTVTDIKNKCFISNYGHKWKAIFPILHSEFGEFQSF